MNDPRGKLQGHGLGRGADEEQHEKLLRVDSHACPVGIVGRAVGRQAIVGVGRKAVAVRRHERRLGTGARQRSRRLQRRHVLNVVTLALLFSGEAATMFNF